MYENSSVRERRKRKEHYFGSPGKADGKNKKNVLVLDIDESNYGLHSQLGLAAPRDLMEYFGGKKGFKEKQRAAPKQTQFWGLAAENNKGQPVQQQSRFFSRRDGVFFRPAS